MMNNSNNSNNKEDENIKNQQTLCLNILNEVRDGLRNKYENNNNNNSSLDGSILETMFKLKEQHNVLDELIDEKYIEPIQTTIERVNQYDSKKESLQYEKIMLQSEINDLAQLDFDLDNPSLGISSLSYFLSNQSPDYIQLFNTKPKEKQSIERLEWELYQRKLKLIELDNLRNLKIKLKEKDEKANNELREFQDKLKANLNVKKAVEPFQKFIGVVSSSKNINVYNPLLLESPQPLYILYHELVYFKEFFFNDNLIVNILKSDDDNMEDDNNSSNNKPLITPSKVYISLQIKKNEKELLIEFYYYPNLKIVTVSPSLNGDHEMGQKLLESLDNSDTGLMTPNLSNHFIFESFGKDLFKLDEHNLNGRPYKWVQFITGLSFLPEITPNNMKDKNFQLHDFQPKTSHQIFFDIINSL